MIRAVLFLFVASASIFATPKKLRDPFSFPISVDQQRKRKKLFHIIGVVQYKKLRGILVQDGEKQRTLGVGDKIKGYTLHTIATDYVEFMKKNKIKRVEIG